MHEILDDYAHNNALGNISPRLKLFLALGSILISVASTAPAAPLLVAVSLSLATVGLARIPCRLYLKLLTVPLSFVLISSAVVVFMHGGGRPVLTLDLPGLTLVAGAGGVDLGLLLVARSLGGTCSLFFLALTTPMVEIFSVLRSLRLPDVLIELSMLTYRYIFVLLEEAVMIHSAQALRLGHTTLRSSLRSFSMLASVLFIRSWERGERLMVAMDSRCYDGRLEVLEGGYPVSKTGILVVLAYLFLVVAVAYLTRDLALYVR